MEIFNKVIEEIQKLGFEEKIESINKLRTMIHQISPFKTEPVDLVLWVKNETVHANGYNPNSVAPPEMELLRLSIEADGYTQPIVSMLEDGLTTREVIDGYHRNRVGKECADIQVRVHGYLPVVTINEECKGINDRMASTIRHNRARGKHKIDAMSEIVMDLKKRNWSNEKISKNLGMDSDEVLRLSQIGGLSELFSDKDFSKSWIAEIDERDEEIQ